MTIIEVARALRVKPGLVRNAIANHYLEAMQVPGCDPIISRSEAIAFAVQFGYPTHRF